MPSKRGIRSKAKQKERIDRGEQRREEGAASKTTQAAGSSAPRVVLLAQAAGSSAPRAKLTARAAGGSAPAVKQEVAGRGADRARRRAHLLRQ